jgi:hypothetical protein
MRILVFLLLLFNLLFLAWTRGLLGGNPRPMPCVCSSNCRPSGSRWWHATICPKKKTGGENARTEVVEPPESPIPPPEKPEKA